MFIKPCHHGVVWLIILIVCYGSAPAQEQDQQSALGSRLGSKINQTDRLYFGLFPDIVDFADAEAVATHDGSIQLNVSRISAKDTVVVLDSESAAELRLYIENLEDIFRTQRQLRWNLLRGVVRPVPFMHPAKRLRVTTREGAEYVGTLVRSTDTTLVLWKEGEAYDWRKVEENAVMLHYSTIEWIDEPGFNWYVTGGTLLAGGVAGWYAASVRGGDVYDALIAAATVGGFSWGFLHSFALATPVMGEIGSYQAVASRIEGLSMFDTLLPPEMRAFIRRKETAASFHSLMPSMTMDQIDAAAPISMFHLTLDRLYAHTLAANQSLIVDLSSYGARGIGAMTRTDELPWNVVATYSIGSRLRVGGRATFYKEPELNAAGPADEHLYGKTFGLLLEYVVLRHDPYLRPKSFLNRVELSGSAGLTYNDFSVNGFRSTGVSYRKTDTLYSTKHELFGAAVGIALDYYATPAYSTRIGVQQQWIPSITTPEPSEVRFLNDYVRSHKIDASMIAISLGIQLHL